MVKILKIIFFTAGIIFASCTGAQITPMQLQRSVLSDIPGCNDQALVKKLYGRLGYQAIWMEKKNSGLRNVLFDFLAHAAEYGLNQTDYQYDLVQSFRDNSLLSKSIEDSIKTEILLSDAAIHFFTEIAVGNSMLLPGYNGLNYKPVSPDIIEKMVTFFANGKFASAVADFEPRSFEYLAIKNKIRWLLKITNDKDFTEVVVISNKPSDSNAPLLVKLYQLGFLDAGNKKITDVELKDKIKKAGKLFNLTQDGIVSKTLLQELNVPVSKRIEELKLALNTWRWLQNARQNLDVIIVNIPSATLSVYQEGKLTLESRIIVGKKSTPTSTLTSRVTEVILYPYWTVPFKIATKELLPAIKRSRAYLTANNYQVLNRQGKVLNPYTINWNELSSSNFPYIIRQSTGCDNSLGLVKLNFYSPYGIYLHDTPGKNLFTRNKRYFSHGCMRVQKAIELAHLILKGNTIAIDTLEEKGCLLHQSPVIVPANVPMAVFVLYNTAWIDAGMNISFNEDVYDKLKTMLKKPTDN
jgi:murein L,D-transpeptidase YcbB/YkuD